MSSTVYVNKISKYFPNHPISNDEMEDYLCQVKGFRSRSKALILRNNKIKNRYYALEKGGKSTHTNAEMTVEAIKGLFDENFTTNDLELLACGTTSPDQILPSHASMVHGKLPVKEIDIVSFSGSCCTGMDALKHAYLSIFSGCSQNAVVTGSERSSAHMTAKNFEKEMEYYLELKKNPAIAFEGDFLRWMLSDGAAAVLLSNQPNKTGISLRIEWIEKFSFANQVETCMYNGGEKNAAGELIGWNSLNQEEWLSHSIFAFKQDIKVLAKHIIILAIEKYAQIFQRRGIKSEDIDYFLPHLSSMYFEEPLEKEMEKLNVAIPKEKWFINLPRVGNVGSASIFLALEELIASERLIKGQKIMLLIPESARFSYSYAFLTVV